jgi:hypothetical protein
MKRRIPFFDFSHSSTDGQEGGDADTCRHWIDVYPSSNFVHSYDSPVAITATITVVATFAVVALIFYIYDNVVNARNRKVTRAAERSQAVVSSLFPAGVRERVMGTDDTSQVEDVTQMFGG